MEKKQIIGKKQVKIVRQVLKKGLQRTFTKLCPAKKNAVICAQKDI